MKLQLLPVCTVLSSSLLLLPGGSSGFRGGLGVLGITERLFDHYQLVCSGSQLWPAGGIGRCWYWAALFVIACALCLQGMEDWDQETLEKVVREKHGAEKPTNATNIICKYFLEAVEKRQYGWFWKCPNGGDCKYR